MAPATESIMGSLPLGKAGVGSAVNDTSRQVGGALGVAIIGSALSSYYGSHIADALKGQSPKVVTAAKSSIGGAIDAAAKIGGPAGNSLATLAKEAFVGGMHRGAIVAAISALIGAIIAALYLPARPPAATVEEQEAELAAEIGDLPHALTTDAPAPVAEDQMAGDQVADPAPTV
jgi:hypothetical protein